MVVTDGEGRALSTPDRRCRNREKESKSSKTKERQAAERGTDVD
jgi:hypothetical protein